MAHEKLAAGSDERVQTVGEEIANAVSHGAGFLALLAATPLLLAAAWAHGAMLGACVFAGSAALLYFSSTLYHALPRCRGKNFFRMLDHLAIFLLIAGTYTPFVLGPLRNWDRGLGWKVLGLIWLLALAGILFKAVARYRFPNVSNGLYLGMGWLAVLLIRPLATHLPAEGLRWLILGGLAYTAGIIFYIRERVRYAHFVWHLFVIAGTTCHFLAVLWYAV